MNEDAEVKARHFDELVGTEWLSDDPDDARVRLTLRDELRQPFGPMHGGVMSTIVESVCSKAAAAAVYDDGQIALGQSISMNFIRPVLEGGIEVRARARHRGRTTWVWDVEITDDAGRLCALTRMTIAVRPIPA